MKPDSAKSTDILRFLDRYSVLALSVSSHASRGEELGAGFSQCVIVTWVRADVEKALEADGLNPSAPALH